MLSYQRRTIFPKLPSLSLRVALFLLHSEKYFINPVMLYTRGQRCVRDVAKCCYVQKGQAVLPIMVGGKQVFCMAWAFPVIPTGITSDDELTKDKIKLFLPPVPYSCMWDCIPSFIPSLSIYVTAIVHPLKRNTYEG